MLGGAPTEAAENTNLSGKPSLEMVSFDGTAMQIDIRTDSHIAADELPLAQVRSTVEQSLQRFAAHINHAEIQLGQAQAQKAGWLDQNCSIEVRLRGRQSMVVEHAANSLELAVSGALSQLARVIDSAFDRSRVRLRLMPMVPAEVSGAMASPQMTASTTG